MEPSFRLNPPGDPVSLNGATARRLRWLSVDRSNGGQGAFREPTVASTGIAARGYEAVDDPAELRIAVRELHRVRAWIGQFADVASEMPGFAPESVVGAKATGAMVTLLIERAEARMRTLAKRTPVEAVVSPTLALEPGQASMPNICSDSDVIMVVLSGAADLLWWDDDGVIHKVTYKPGQHVCIRQGTRHCAVSSGEERMVASLIRATASKASGKALRKTAADISAVDPPDGSGAIAAG